MKTKLFTALIALSLATGCASEAYVKPMPTTVVGTVFDKEGALPQAEILVCEPKVEQIILDSYKKQSNTGGEIYFTEAIVKADLLTAHKNDPSLCAPVATSGVDGRFVVSGVSTGSKVIVAFWSKHPVLYHWQKPLNVVEGENKFDLPTSTADVSTP